MDDDLDDEEKICPLCCEELDLPDQHFLPCKCGYQVCMWCWHHIKENLNGLCPACRTPYQDDPHAFSAVDKEEIIKNKKERKLREKAKARAEEKEMMAKAATRARAPQVAASPEVVNSPTLSARNLAQSAHSVLPGANRSARRAALGSAGAQGQYSPQAGPQAAPRGSPPPSEEAQRLAAFFASAAAAASADRGAPLLASGTLGAASLSYGVQTRLASFDRQQPPAYALGGGSPAFAPQGYGAAPVASGGGARGGAHRHAAPDAAPPSRGSAAPPAALGDGGAAAVPSFLTADDTFDALGALVGSGAADAAPSRGGRGAAPALRLAAAAGAPRGRGALDEQQSSGWGDTPQQRFVGSGSIWSVGYVSPETGWGPAATPHGAADRAGAARDGWGTPATAAPFAAPPRDAYFEASSAAAAAVLDEAVEALPAPTARLSPDGLRPKQPPTAYGSSFWLNPAADEAAVWGAPPAAQGGNSRSPAAAPSADDFALGAGFQRHLQIFQ